MVRCGLICIDWTACMLWNGSGLDRPDVDWYTVLNDLGFIGLVWVGLVCNVLVWIGLVWIEMVLNDLGLIGLACIALVCNDLVWIGPIWSGIVKTLFRSII